MVLRWFVDDGLIINSAFLDGLNVEDGKKKAIEKLIELGQGESQTTYRLRDWGVSRQRYWGCPVPVIHCEKCGTVPVPEEDLPVTLPDDVEFEEAGNPLDRHPNWRDVACPCCGKAARRETGATTREGPRALGRRRKPRAMEGGKGASRMRHRDIYHRAYPRSPTLESYRCPRGAARAICGEPPRREA